MSDEDDSEQSRSSGNWLRQIGMSHLHMKAGHAHRFADLSSHRA